MPPPARRGAGPGMPADEALVVDRLDQLPLGRADVRDHAVSGRGRQRSRHLFGQHAHGSAGEAYLRAVERLLEAAAGPVEGAELECALEPLGATAEAHDL